MYQQQPMMMSGMGGMGMMPGMVGMGMMPGMMPELPPGQLMVQPIHAPAPIPYPGSDEIMVPAGGIYYRADDPQGGFGVMICLVEDMPDVDLSLMEAAARKQYEAQQASLRTKLKEDQKTDPFAGKVLLVFETGPISQGPLGEGTEFRRGNNLLGASTAMMMGGVTFISEFLTWIATITPFGHIILQKSPMATMGT